MGIDGNETADQSARQDSSHPLIGPKPAFGISAKDARGVIRDWTSWKHEEHWQSKHGQSQTTGFLKRPSAKSRSVAQPEQKLAKNNDRAAKRTLSFKRYLCNLGLVNSLKGDRCKQASRMASHVLCDCETFIT
jgi:hypothetical protein